MSKRNIHNWSVGVWCLYDFFLQRFLLTGKLLEHSKLISPIIGVFLLVGSIYYLIRKQDGNRYKTYEEITSEENLGNYMQLLFLLGVAEIDVCGHLGVWVQISLYVVFLLCTITVILKEWLDTRDLSSFMCALMILGYIVYSWTEDTYVRHYGNEIIGSYWAKPNYKTKYFVKISNSRDSKKERVLPAKIHVFSETYHDDYIDFSGEVRYKSNTVEHIILEKVFLKDGNCLTFYDDCELEIGEKIFCVGEDDEDWYIELTERKAE